MDALFDRLARALARRINRREALRLGSGAVAAAAIAAALPVPRVIAIGTCPAGTKSENCKKGRISDCVDTGELECGCVKRSKGGELVCVERICTEIECKKDEDCPEELLCVKAKDCCEEKKFCAIPCGLGDALRPARRKARAGRWSQ